MYRKGTLIIMGALALTLMVATVATGAPKEKRVVCQDGVTKEIPAHAKAKGATEGPCEETPGETEAERICREQYFGGTVLPDGITCEYTYWGSTEWVAPNTSDRIFVEAYFTNQMTWDGTAFTDQREIGADPVTCYLLEYPNKTELPLDDSRCQIPNPRPDS